MSTFGAVALCILSVIGLAAVIWALAGAFLLPVKTGQDCRVHIVVSAKGKSPEIPRLVRALIWVLDAGLLDFDIVIYNNGLAAEAEKCARLLSTEDAVSYADGGDIRTYIDL